MQVNAWSGLNVQYPTYSTPRATYAATTRVQTGPGREDLRRQSIFNHRSLIELRDALRDISTDWKISSGGSESRAVAARVRSSTDLGLGAATSGYLESTEQVNATPTSFETHGPAWTGGSEPLATIDGEYDGGDGNETLSVVVTDVPTNGNTRAVIEVLHEDGSRLRRIRINNSHEVGRVYNMGNGLEISFGAGDFVEGDSFTLDVFADVGGVADPSNPFDGTRTADANLDFGLDVTAGSFDLNGTTINVAAGDSITTVLDRINDADIGVTAAYSTLTELITLSLDASGAGGGLTLENDTSGFLDATKLTGATFMPGEDDHLDSLMVDVPRFAGVTAGSIRVNGLAIGLDPGADTLQAVIDRINASSAGVTGSVDPTGRHVTFTSDDAESTLTLDDDGTGFFASLAITPGTWEPGLTEVREAGMTSRRARRITDAMRKVAETVNELFGGQVPGGEAGSGLIRTRGQLQAAIAELLEGDRRADFREMGLEFDWDARGGRVFRFHDVHAARFNSAIRSGERSVQDLLLGTGPSGRDGFVGSLLEKVESLADLVDAELGSTGRSLDTYA